MLFRSSRVPSDVILLQNGSRVKVPKPILVANSFTHLRALCKAGVGFALLGDTLVESEFRSGELVQVLKDVSFRSFPLFIFCRAEEYRSVKVRSFMDFFDQS